jgi:glycosyltransferase involved in cell wall biosynthesis
MPYQADLRHAATISPIKLFEAMAAGRLVIASDLPPIREVIRHGENGLLVPADDPAAWIAAVRRAQDAPDHAMAMAMKGRETAAEYDWGTRARRLLTFCCPDQPQSPSD